MYYSAASPPPTHSILLGRDAQCGFEGNPDLYGLGIRLGFYFQWVSAFISFGWYPEAGHEVYSSYLLFIFAIAITIIVTTARSEPAHAVEILILTYFIFGGLYAVSIGAFSGNQNQGANGKRLKRTQWIPKVLIESLTLSAPSLYCAWFWLSGINQKFLKTPCGTYGFLFSKISLYKPSIRKFFAALSIYFAICILLGIVMVIYLRWNQSPPGSPSPSPSRTSARKNKKNTFVQTMVHLIISGSSFVYSVLAIELTLHWNSITGVNTIDSAGQLIPFVIGVAGLVKIIFGALHERREDSDSEADDASNPDEESPAPMSAPLRPYPEPQAELIQQP